jgi:hypothetical protein
VEYTNDMIYQDQQNGDAAPAVKGGDSASREGHIGSFVIAAGLQLAVIDRVHMLKPNPFAQYSSRADFCADQMEGAIIESLT